MLNKWHEEVETVYDQMVAWRRHLHENPELSFEEDDTARMVADILAGYGIEVRQNVGGHGVVGTLKGSKSGQIIALRADMDALPIQEENDVPYKSQVPNVMHACGHDAHTATLLGVAKILGNHRGELNGTVVFIFQPAEEKSPGGASKMIEDGALKGVDYIFGNHVLPSVRLGTYSVPKGSTTAAIDTFELKIIGKGGHSSQPQTAVNPIVVGVQIVNQLHMLMSQKLNPLEPAVTTVTMFNAGNAPNAIPTEATISGTFRSFTESELKGIGGNFKKIIENVTDTYGSKYELNYTKGYPPQFNTLQEVEVVREVLNEINGMQVIEELPIMASKDFSYYVRKVPGVYFFTGSSTDNPNTQFPNHHPKCDIDERVMKNSAKAFLSIVDYYLVKSKNASS